MEAVVLLLLLLTFFFGLMRKDLRRLIRLTPEDLREVGVVVKSARALDDAVDVIGRYMGVDIYRAVTFKGVRYEFNCVAPPAFKRYLRGRQLYLEPGLVYVSM